MAQLVLLFHLFGAAVIAARDAPCGSGKLFQRFRKGAHDQHRTGERQDKRASQQQENGLGDGKIGRQRLVQRIVKNHEYRRTMCCRFKRRRYRQEFAVVCVDHLGLDSVSAGQGNVAVAFGLGDNLPCATIALRGQRDGALFRAHRAQLVEQSVVHGDTRRDEGNRNGCQNRHRHYPVDMAIKRCESGASVVRGRVA